MAGDTHKCRPPTTLCMAEGRTHYRCEECGYAWRGSEEMPLSRCPRCGRSDRLVAVDDEAEEERQTAQRDEGGGMGGRFSMSTELAMVAAIVAIVLLAAAGVVTFLFWLSGTL